MWQDEAGATHVSYNDPVWLAHRHGLGAEDGAPVHAMSNLLGAIVAAAAAP